MLFTVFLFSLLYDYGYDIYGGARSQRVSPAFSVFNGKYFGKIKTARKVSPKNVWQLIAK